ncbi:hypothetical protein [Streptosporangium lutulentum]|uniref:Uncharacterized protein n=1 Tax=Streptosporangium lutulentum TaxID=1461250 RepID=A0ABT9Q7C9_9ACTN|nr:hypothetical protein [Streptosporangium lutulentum]MDP9842286.1 hypothetical protein [Streptosporangium lutulentum]
MPVLSSEGTGPRTVLSFALFPSAVLDLRTVPMTSQATTETVPGPVLGSVPCFVPSSTHAIGGNQR